MRRVAFVVQRCGADVNGGSEKLCLDVARHLAGRAEVEILTTCALDYRSWANHYPPGGTEIAGVPARRFPVTEERRLAAFDRASQRLRPRLGRIDLPEAEAWMRAQGPWAPALFAYLREHRRDYDAFFFFTYLYATSYYGLPEVEERAYLVPFAHEEWPLELPVWDRFFARPRGFVFSTPEEQRLLRRRFPRLALPGALAGAAPDPPARCDPGAFRARYGLDGPFWLYLGRIEPSKGCLDLLEAYARYRASRPDAAPLVLVGRAFMDVPATAGVVQTGFVDEQTKWDALAACQALIMPSPYESLSIVLLEAWSVGRPVLVNGGCEVLVGQTRRAQGGLWYSDAHEFAAALERLREPALAHALGAQGRRFVQGWASWDRITRVYLDAIEAGIGARGPAFARERPPVS